MSWQGEVIYVSGPMSGKPGFNFQSFDEVTDTLRGRGANVFSPAEHDRHVLALRGIHDVTQVDGFAEGDLARYVNTVGDLGSLLAWDFDIIVNHATGIVMLPGWQASTGARYERVIAEALNHTVYLAHNLSTTERLHGWAFSEDYNPKRLTQWLAPYGVMVETVRG